MSRHCDSNALLLLLMYMQLCQVIVIITIITNGHQLLSSSSSTSSSVSLLSSGKVGHGSNRGKDALMKVFTPLTTLTHRHYYHHHHHHHLNLISVQILEVLFLRYRLDREVQYFIIINIMLQAIRPFNARAGTTGPPIPMTKWTTRLSRSDQRTTTSASKIWCLREAG